MEAVAERSLVQVMSDMGPGLGSYTSQHVLERPVKQPDGTTKMQTYAAYVTEIRTADEKPYVRGKAFESIHDAEQSAIDALLAVGKPPTPADFVAKAQEALKVAAEKDAKIKELEEKLKKTK